MKYVVANWKMNLDAELVSSWVMEWEKNQNQGDQPYGDTIPILAPSFVHIPFLFLELPRLNGVFLSSQDISHYEKGAHTGEIGAFQVKDLCRYCIIGHSERNESFDTVITKRDLALKEGIIPIVCFVSEKDAPKYYARGTILAWEDPLNISGDFGYNAKPLDEIRVTAEKIKSVLPKDALLLYGGSVNRENIGRRGDSSGISGISFLDGVLVGGASLDPHHFGELVKAYSE